MRLLIASDAFAPKIDGVADTAGTIARSFASRGHDVVVAAPGPGATEIDGFRVARLSSIPLPVYPEVRVTLPVRRMARLVERFRPDAIVVMTPGPVGVAAVRALRPGIRLVHIYTTDIPEYLDAYHFGFAGPAVERMLRWMSSQAVATLCPTERVRAELESRGHVRLEVWGRGVNTALFNPSRASMDMRVRMSGGEPQKPLVIYVGRLAREKRLFDLHQAAQSLDGIRYALVGDGPQRDILERRFAVLPTVFTGYLRGEPLAEAFASADVFAFPSDTETFGQVVLQAMASGLPPVVVRASAPAEFVRDGIDGVHIPPRDPVAFAAALRALVDDPERRASMSRAAATHAREFSWDALMDRLEALSGGVPQRLGVAV